MEDWVTRALARWPNVPALFGWLALDGHGHWRIKGERISRVQIIDTFNRNYAADEHGRWYFQNGPQRGYVTLALAPLVLWVDGSDALVTHTGLTVETADAAYLDEHGGLWLTTAHGPAVLDDKDLGWALEQLRCGDGPMDEAALAAALALPSGAATALQLQLGARPLALARLNVADAPTVLGFVREPQPLPGEKTSH